MEQYIPNFIEHQVTGDRLLKLTIEELDTLNITKMGHKELMLEAVDLLSTVVNNILMSFCIYTEKFSSIALGYGNMMSKFVGY